MSNHELLDNITHKDVKIITDHHPMYGDTANYTNIFNSEFGQCQNEYPIFFRKNTESGQFETITLFGFEQEENLYLDENGWHAHYIPLTIQRRPFLIGFQHNTDDGIVSKEPVVHIDIDNKRVSKTKGEPIFLPSGGHSPLLQNISSVLNTVHIGHAQNTAFIQELLHLDLIESVNIDISLNNNSSIKLPSLYAIHEERLSQLKGDKLAELHIKGYLKDIYMIIASMANLTGLIKKKNLSLTNKNIAL